MFGSGTPLRTRHRLGALAAGALLLAACGSDDASSSDPTSSDPAAGNPATSTQVVVTTSIWADITSNVACDGLAEVRMIIPPGGDPHSFEPSLRDREAMDAADVIVANGLFLEESLEDTIDAAESGGVTVLRVGEGLDPIPTAAASSENADHEGDDHDKSDADAAHDEDAAHDDEAAHDDHGDEDPHVWWDPTRIATAVALIADALADAGVDRAALDACVATYLDELTALDDDIEALVAPLDDTQRILVTNHDSLGYFADRYDFEVLGSVIPSSSSLAATSPADLDALAADIEATGVSAIFADTQNSSDDADALADRIGDIEVVSMLTDTLDEPGSAQGTYVGWLRQNVETIVEALGGAS
jgi:ABC-type Zn uptake system ZnuABC Zn-binding protein ZnuA